MSALWDVIVSGTKQPSFAKYKDVFPVVVFDHLAPSEPSGDEICVNLINGKTQGKSLDKAMEIWRRNVDMRYVPKGNMEYRVESTMYRCKMHY